MSAVAESTAAPVAQQVSPVVAASAAALNLFQAHRHGRRNAIRQAWADHHASVTADLLIVGADIAEYIADGLAAGIKRAELVQDCVGDDCSEADVSVAVKLHHLARLTGCDLSKVSYRRAAPLMALVSRDAETEQYTLAGDAEKAKGLVECVVRNEVATREAVKEHVGKLLGKAPVAKPATTPTIAAPAPQANPIATPAVAPTVSAPIPADEPKPANVGISPIDAAQAAYRGLTVAHDTTAAAKALGAILGQNPKLLGPIIAGLVDWAASERTQQASMVYSALVMAVKSGAAKLVEAGLRIGG